MTYGKWTVIGKQYRKGKTHYYTPCECECGIKKDIATSTLKSGKSTQCRKCAGKTSIHGQVGTPIYSRWQGMNNRCRLSKSYIKKGIIVEWNNFAEFYKDMGDTFDEELEIDRTDNSGNYCKNNCKWIPKALNAANRDDASKFGTGIFKHGNKYRASISNKGKVVYLKSFDDINIALRDRDNYIIEHNLKNKLNLEAS